MKLSELVAGVRPVVARFGDAEINVRYRLAERTLAGLEADEDPESDHPWIVRVIESWDITDDADLPIPITLDAVKQVPMPVLNAITRAIYEDNGLGEVASNSAAT